MCVHACADECECVCVLQERSETEQEGRSDTVFRGPIADITGFPGGSVVKNLPANARALRSILGSRRAPGRGNGNPLHVHFRSLYLKPSSPTNFTFISNLHLLCPQPEFINCSFNILIKFSVRHFNILASPSIPFCFPGDSLLEPLALLTHPGLAGLDTSHTAGTSSWEFHFPHSC